MFPRRGFVIVALVTCVNVAYIDGISSAATNAEVMNAAEKRGFKPWGGKRAPEPATDDKHFNELLERVWSAKNDRDDEDAEMDELLDDKAAIVRRGFKPWGGKRFVNAEVERRGFKPWGGKRNIDWEIPVSLQMRAIRSIADEAKNEKRGFKPWGGKRNLNAVNSDQSKRGFKPWGGKRSVIDDADKRGFKPWGGKRHWTADDVKRGFKPWGGKRGFKPWGGKRTSGDGTSAEKRGFKPWGGKRDEFHAELDEIKRGFKPWGGKRNSLELPPNSEHRRLSDDSPLVQKPQTRGFKPWGGK
ncbi:uncharacterized protein LOC141907067 [Tubulanus polymorphus]|uniref:uncharacterized protein LOC141907067 n=1 Tax=Tubulanus polymorphus TaxID=672921 RepID=UPI003DA438ED